MQHPPIELPIDAIRDYCCTQPVKRLSVFGSVLRGDFDSGSDVDLLVEFQPGTHVTYFDLYDMQQALESLIGRDVDLLTPKALSPYLRDDVESTAEVIYEAGWPRVSFARILIELAQEFTLLHTFLIIEPQHQDSSTPFQRQRFDDRTIQAEVCFPVVTTVMKQKGRLIRRWISRSNVGSLEQVAARTAQSEITLSRLATMWLSDTENGYAERVIRTIKEEKVYLSEYEDYADAYAQLGHFIDQVYQHKRIHSALGYLTPAEFEAQWHASQSL